MSNSRLEGELTVEQLDAMATIEVGSFFNKKLKIQTINIEAISPKVLAELKSKTLAKLTPQQVGGLSPDQLKVLGEEQVEDLPEESVDALIKNNKLQHLPGAVLAILGTKIKFKSGFTSSTDTISTTIVQLSSLIDNGKLGFISANVIASLDSDIITEKNLGKSRLESLSRQMNSEQFNAINESVTSGKKKIREMLKPNFMSIGTLRGLGAGVLSNLSEEQFARFDESHLKAITPDQAKKLSKEHINALSRANKLHNLQPAVLGFLSREGKIGDLSEEQLRSLVDSGQLRMIPDTISAMGDKLREIADSKLFESVMNTEFENYDQPNGGTQIKISDSGNESIKNLASFYIDEKDRIPVARGGKPREFIEGHIMDHVKSESWETMVSSCTEWIAEYKDSTNIIPAALEKEIDISPREVYGLIDRVNLLRTKVIFDNDKNARKDYARLMETVESLVRAAKNGSIDERSSAMDTILSLASDKHMDANYRNILCEELIKMDVEFRVDYYGTPEIGAKAAHRPVRERSQKIYLSQAEVFVEKEKIDTVEFGKRLEELKKELEKDGNYTEEFRAAKVREMLTPGEISYLEALARTQEIDPDRKDAGNVSFYISEGTKAIMGLVAVGALAKVVKNITGSNTLATVARIGGMAAVGKGFADKAMLQNYMSNSKNIHDEERVKSEARGVKIPFSMIDRFKDLSRRLKNILFRIRGKKWEDKGDTGFDRYEYMTSKNKKTVQAGCQTLRKANQEELKRRAVAGENKKYIEQLKDFNSTVLSSAVKDDVSKKVKKLVDDLEKNNGKLFDCWLSRESVELAKKFPGVRVKEGKSLNKAITDDPVLGSGQNISHVMMNALEESLAANGISIGSLSAKE
ncbi:MAG: hypothetical protein LBI29_01045, partial [Rickettsiales bacterium]|nr:hypothetical protein [Rickettsiales bacterium]